MQPAIMPSCWQIECHSSVLKKILAYYIMLTTFSGLQLPRCCRPVGRAGRADLCGGWRSIARPWRQGPRSPASCENKNTLDILFFLVHLHSNLLNLHVGQARSKRHGDPKRHCLKGWHGSGEFARRSSPL